MTAALTQPEIQSRPAPLPPPPTDALRLARLVQRVEAGETPPADELESLAGSTDRATRGAAKRMLAVLRLEEGRRAAADLLAEACDDLEYRFPGVIAEALAHAEGLGRHARAFDLRVGAASAAAQRGECVPALVHLLNAAALDFQRGARHINEPAHLRRLIAVYERVARLAAGPAGVRPSPRFARRSPASGRLRLAHVTCQLVSKGHAPTRAIDTLLKFADRERFDTHLFVTEALAKHERHEGQLAQSFWTTERGADAARRFEQDYGVPVILPKSRESWLTAAPELHARMAELQIDVAFFHGSIATPTDWLMCAWRCAPWQFDRAFGVPLYCPALDYQFFEFEETMDKLAFLCRERGIAHGFSPYGSVDLSHVATAEPLPRSNFGVPDDHVILGTIGNHLPARMSEGFCRAVAAAMRANARTTFLVIGPGPFDRQRGWLGSDLCGDGRPGARVLFPGSTEQSDRMTQTFDICLNPYPEGGGFSVCDAMAASKPVAAMLVGDSALGLAGATYVGEEHLVRPASDENYTRRLCELIADPAERRRVGAAMYRRYETYFNGRRWAEDMSGRIFEFVQSTMK